MDGVALPLAVAGHPGAEFCNTRAGWRTQAPKEYLTSYAALALWTREAGLVTVGDAAALRADADRRPAVADGVLAGAVALREALYPVLLDRQRRGAPWDRVAAAAGRTLGWQRLAAGAGPVAGWERSLPPPPGLDPLELPVLAVAAAAAGLLVSPAATAVRACAGVGCGWLFVDPGGRRRWCSMAVCGNRAKARRHAGRAQSR